MNKKKAPTIYIDVDGTLTEWNEKAGPDLWSLAKYIWMCVVMPNMIRAVQIIFDNWIGEVKFLTASISDEASTEKIEFLKRHIRKRLPKNSVIIVPYGQKKTDFVDATNGILIDDYTKNLFDWEEAGGAGAIKVRNNINGRNGTWNGSSVHYQQAPESIAQTILAEAYFIYNKEEIGWV